MIVSNTTCVNNAMRFWLTMDSVPLALDGASVECRVDGSNEIIGQSWQTRALPFVLRVNQSETFHFHV